MYAGMNEPALQNVLASPARLRLGPHHVERDRAHQRITHMANSQLGLTLPMPLPCN